MYRCTSPPVFLDEFYIYLENVIMCPELLIIAGDFNFHLDLVHSNNSRRFEELLETFSLSQQETVSKHISGHVLDRVITRSTDDQILGPISTSLRCSDHLIVECFVYFLSPFLFKESVSFLKLKGTDIYTFKSDIM